MKCFVLVLVMFCLKCKMRAKRFSQSFFPAKNNSVLDYVVSINLSS